MNICKECGKEFPNWITIDGKKHNLRSRVRCLECSPLGKQATKPIRKPIPLEKKCSTCQDILPIEMFGIRGDGRGDGYVAECKPCFKDRMGRRHQSHKKILVDAFGGKCSRCGYDDCIDALVFHHVEPATKSFGISARLSTNIETLMIEAAKCILICHNCHAEKHAGLW